MPDYYSKNIPVLDDIIEDDSEEKAAAHDKIIATDEMHTDDNTLDLFNETADIEIDNAEPEIGTIDQFIDEAVEIDIEAIAAPENETPDDEVQAAEADSFESALIDYSHEDDDEQVLEQEAESDISAEATGDDDSQTSEAPEVPNDLAADSGEASSIPEPAIDLDAIIDDVVTQLMPELEQQLRSRLKQTLQESLLQENSEETTSE